MIVQGVILAAIAYKLFVAPTKAVVAVSKLVERGLAADENVVIQDGNGNQLSFPAGDFFDSKGERHTAFGVGKVETEEGMVEVVFSGSEVEMLQFVSYAEDQDMEVSKPALESLCESIKKRRDEITRSPNRRVTRK